MSLRVNVAVRVPEAAGSKVTEIEQFFPTATLGSQVFVWVKSPLLVPVMVTLLTSRVALPELVSVTVIAALVVPTNWLGKVRLVGESVTLGPGAKPVPVRLMLCGLPLPLSVSVTAPVRVPVVVGVNVTEMVQVCPTARLVPQVLVAAKSPLVTMLVKLTEPLADTVTI